MFSLNRHLGALGKHHQGCNGQERTTGQNGFKAFQLLFHWNRTGGSLLFGIDEPEHQNRKKGQATEDQEYSTPVSEFQRSPQGHGGTHRSQTSRNHLQAVHQGQAIRGKPEDVGFEGSHQTGGNAETDKQPSQDQSAQGFCHGKDQRSQGGKDEQYGFGPAWPKTIQQQSQGKLEGCEGDEINTGQ